MTTTAKAHAPIPPGETPLTEFLEPLGISQNRLAQATGLPQTRISEIVRGKRSITTDTALRLSKALGAVGSCRPTDVRPPQRAAKRSPGQPHRRMSCVAYDDVPQGRAANSRWA